MTTIGRTSPGSASHRTTRKRVLHTLSGVLVLFCFLTAALLAACGRSEEKKEDEESSSTRKTETANAAKGREEYERGIALLKKDKEKEEALEAFRKAAEYGNAEAQAVHGFYLLVMSSAGDKEEDPEAVRFLKASADQNCFSGQVLLGMYHVGALGFGSGDRSFVQALFPIRKIIPPGMDPEIDKREREGVEYLGKAAEHPPTDETALDLLFQGKDSELILNQHATFSDELTAMAQVSLCVAYMKGYGVKKDLKESQKWFKKARETGISKEVENELRGAFDEASRMRIDDFEDEDDFKDFRKDTGKGREEYRKGIAAFDAGNYSRAVTAFRESAGKGCADAIMMLEICYQNGRGVNNDREEALRFLRKAAKMDQPLALAFLGTSLGSVSEQDGLRYLKKAADQDCIYAQFMLGLHYTGGTIPRLGSFNMNSMPPRRILFLNRFLYGGLNPAGRDADDEPRITDRDRRKIESIDRNDQNGVEYYRKAASHPLVKENNIYDRSVYPIHYLTGSLFRGEDLSPTNQCILTARLALCMAYLNGYGVEKDLKEAQSWFEYVNSRKYGLDEDLRKELLEAFEAEESLSGPRGATPTDRKDLEPVSAEMDVEMMPPPEEPTPAGETAEPSLDLYDDQQMDEVGIPDMGLMLDMPTPIAIPDSNSALKLRGVLPFGRPGGGGMGDGDKGRGNLQGMLQGVFYDLKQTKDRQPGEEFRNDSGSGEYIHARVAPTLRIMREFVNGSWRREYDSDGRVHYPALDKYYCPPTRLWTSCFFTEEIPAAEAPKVYQCEDAVKPAAWVCIYSGNVVAPFSGKFRFLGTADDVLLVRFNKEIVLDYGCASFSTGEYWTMDRGASNLRSLKSSSGNEIRNKSSLYRQQRLEVYPARSGGAAYDLAKGLPITVKEGEIYPIEVLISEIPGGHFCQALYIERLDDNGQPLEPNPTRFTLFQTTLDQPEQPTRSFPEFTPYAPIWRVVRSSTSSGSGAGGSLTGSRSTPGTSRVNEDDDDLSL